ncbi:inositol-3-phosphate synthase [Pseudorhizobium banfieldiae]|uniref:inositol-3-phosphate synthase n=1 Tax=Pseudorhizobium banfieldiae TaxID=1125847 RepID=UPI001FCD3C49|nr:inositol-3-phosphate synthase [Pseudorhizobium banfieldiae]
MAAFDIDRRKVGLPLAEAIFAAPNNTQRFFREVPDNDVTVAAGPALDGVSAMMRNSEAEASFQPIVERPITVADIAAVLKQAQAQVVISFLPVGSELASEFYAQCAIEAGAAFVNGIPVFLASRQSWARRFEAAGLPVLGDDFKAQIGATIVHRALANLFKIRGAELDRSYQLNVGGNTDFMNMMDMDRLTSKRISKTEAVQSAVKARLDDNNVRIGPSDYVPWLMDQKVAYIRLEGRLFGGVATNVELRLSVEDSPNAAAMALIAIRCARIALDRGVAGAIPDVCAFLFKHPPVQMDDQTAAEKLTAFASQGKGS